MSLAGFCLNDNGDNNPIAAIDGNICRCTGYKSIERAAGKLTKILNERKGEDADSFVTKKKIFPPYFSTIQNRLQHPGNGQLAPVEPNHPGSQFKIVGGGTDLYVQQHDEMTHAPIHFLFDQPAMNGMSREGNKCIMGNSVTATDLKNSDIINQAFPGFHRYAKLISSTPIRNMATIAGNFANASPIGDFTIFFLALDARVCLSDGKNKREIPLRKLYKGYKQLDKKPGEYIEQVWFELPVKNSLFNFEKVSKRTNLDIASVNSAFFITMDEDRIGSAAISAGGVGPVPMYLEKTSIFLSGQFVSEELIYKAIEIAHIEISPISDARGTKEYKTLLLGQLIKAHFLVLFPGIKFSNLINT